MAGPTKSWVSSAYRTVVSRHREEAALGGTEIIPTRRPGQKKSDTGGIEPRPDPWSTNAMFGAEEAGIELPIRVFAVAAALPKSPLPGWW
jgi:hypothetical protein